MKNYTQVALIVLDGWGHREDTKNNAVASAKTPNFNKYWDMYPHSLLEASGLAVGLPEGQMGNSEIGHTTIGAGKVLDTDLVRIAKSIANGEFEQNPTFLKLFSHVKENNSVLHIKGIVGTGGVHGHQDHLIAFIRAAKKHGVEKIAIHAFTDGRDSAPKSASAFLKEIEEVLEEVGIGHIATMSGRFYAMDRDNNWDRIEKATNAMFKAEGKSSLLKPSEMALQLYTEGHIDEHFEPVVFLDAKGQTAPLRENDAIFFFNFRADRTRQISKKILEEIEGKNILFATLTEYHKDFKCEIAFPVVSLETVLAKEIADAGLSQAHIAETEKFPHATFFLNGGKNEPHTGERHIMLDSRKDVLTHDLAPKMRAEGIADAAIKEVEAGTNFIFINFANPDMVGHTANVPAIIEAVEEVDTQFTRVVEAMQKAGGVVFFTADHGNAEVNVDPETGEKHTSHTINPVPAVLTDANLGLRGGTLADIAPTVLTLFGLHIPESMTGKSLVS
ncbi:MAG: 2,3-bisphosphoglycerate-independent phosphoglycerate mutase [Candidatus Zambryskibacteria bacterium]|nr:2,3-bisphosphoglycerate-independent phosphoglycerate mutase [Candidatus Zambryskibacteria bacterium]